MRKNLSHDYFETFDDEVLQCEPITNKDIKQLHNTEEDLCSTIIARDFSKDRARLTKEQLLDKEKYATKSFLK